MDKDHQSASPGLGEDRDAWLASKIVCLFDQFASEEKSRCTKRTMHWLASRGFHTGGIPVFGYRAAAAEVQGTRVRKKLVVHPDEAKVVKRIFDLAQHGDNGEQLNARGIARFLNEAGCSLRGARFTSPSVTRVLSRTHYVGYYSYGAEPSGGEERRHRQAARRLSRNRHCGAVRECRQASLTLKFPKVQIAR